jgi:hypothetical protein
MHCSRGKPLWMKHTLNFDEQNNNDIINNEIIMINGDKQPLFLTLS